MNFIFIKESAAADFEHSLSVALHDFRNLEVEIQYVPTAVVRGQYEVQREYTALVIGRPRA